MKKTLSMLLAFSMLLGLLTTMAFAAPADTTITVTDDRTYEVYQIFVGDLSDTTLSNVKWGQNGTGTAGEAVDEAVFEALEAVKGKSDTEKLAVIEDYVNFDSQEINTVSKDAPLTVKTGYYLLKDVTTGVTNGQELSTFVVEIVGPTTITPKVGEVKFEKKVKDTNDTEGTTTDWQDSADHDLNDAVPFLLKGTVTAKYDHYETYYYAFHDQMSEGLTFNENSVVVKVDGNTITEGYEVVTEDLTDGCTFEVVFENLKTINAVKANSTITVEYTATLNENAVIGSAGNPNKAKLEYSNNPNASGEGDTDNTGMTPWDKVIVFTYKTVINKVDGEQKPLAGAEFTLEKKLADGTTKEIAVVKTNEGKTFTFTGLDDGDYILTETMTPAGYNTIEPIEFTITAEHEIESDNPQLTALSGGNLITGEVENNGVDLKEGSITGTVVNNKGSVLPETGGIGTTIFYVLGGLMAVGAGVLLVAKKRMDA